jgi:hypothetical protein
LPHVDDVEASVLEAVENIFRWRAWGKVADYCLYRLFKIWGEGKIVITFLQRGFLV